MTRLANIEKAGYFPLPVDISHLLKGYIHVPHGGRLLDPCAGEGGALLALATQWQMEPFGCELHRKRANQARNSINQFLQNERTWLHTDSLPTRIIQDDYRNLQAPRESFNLLYLNPPYDRDKEMGRLEYQWLRDTRVLLQQDGVLIWVIPHHILQMTRACRYLASHFHSIRVYRFPDPLYNRFKQIVVFGVRRPKSTIPDNHVVQNLKQMGAGEIPLSMLTEQTGEPLYQLPKLSTGTSGFYFRSLFVDPREAIMEARKVGVGQTAVYRQHLDPTMEHTPLQPLTPLKIGHMNGIIAAGHLDNQVLHEDETRLLIKGRNYKTVASQVIEEPLPGGRTKISHIDTEQVVTDITTLTPEGKVTSYKGLQLEQFLGRWITHLTAIVAKSYPPTYQFDLNGFGSLLNALSLSRPIPGLNGKCGLLPAQKHAVAAVLTRLQTESDAVVVGEMGCGKTTIGVAIVAGLKAERTIVLCPPHLTEKWKREAQIVWPKVSVMQLNKLADVEAFFNQAPTPVIGILKKTTARSASGWEHAYDYGGPARHKYSSKGFVDIKRVWGAKITATEYLNLPVEERPISQKRIEYLALRGVRCPTCGAVQMRNGRSLSPTELKSARRFCGDCDAPLFQFRRKRSEKHLHGSFLQYAKRERVIREAIDQLRPIPSFLPPDTRMRDLFGYAKVPLAGYIKRLAKGRLDLLLSDEIHEYKGSNSDQGYAFHHLALTANKTVGLTGTIYGGKASSIFHLLHRLSPEMRRVYTDDATNGRSRLRERDWITNYGILQRVESYTINEDGMQTGNSRTQIRTKELPGGSPAMLPWLLNRSVFLSLRDMGFPLPPYDEIPQEVAMLPEQQVLYESLKSQLKEELKERLIRGDKSLLAGYLYALLFWPDSPRRGKEVICPRSGRVVAHIPGLPEGTLAPKEKAILELCRSEKEKNRKVLLLCQQTDTLDIQPEWKKMLTEFGLKTSILRAVPAKREAWVRKQVAEGVDVIISHPKRVETGIDLLEFPTIVWMAPSYSVYTVLQASRRSWRIGQTHPVKVYYFAYADTLQVQALQVVAAKVAAALRVNGDTIVDDSLAELDDVVSGDVLTTLARIVTGETKLETESLQDAFAKANAELRQANVVIGEYQMLDDETAMAVPVMTPPKPRLVVPRLASNDANGVKSATKAIKQLSLFN